MSRPAWSRTLRPALLLLPALLSHPAFAQNVKLVPDAPACARCRIEQRTIVQLDARGEIPTAPDRVVQDARGRFWLTFANEPAMIYARDGRYLRELTRGKGPAEFEFPWFALPVGDSVFVLDRGRGMAVVGPDLQLVRRQPETLHLGQIIPLRWPDSMLVNTRRYDQRDNMSPFHVVSFAGRDTRLLRSFGAELTAPADARANMMVNLQRLLAPARDGGFWAAQYDRYVLQRWSRAGLLQQTLAREPDWFPREPRRMSFREPPPPLVRALRQDEQGRLWVFSSVAARTWREGYPAFSPGVREVGPEAFAREKLYRTTIEVIDPAAARVMARQTLDVYIVAVLEGGRAAVYGTNDDGVPFVRIVQLTLRQ